MSDIVHNTSAPAIIRPSLIDSLQQAVQFVPSLASSYTPTYLTDLDSNLPTRSQVSTDAQPHDMDSNQPQSRQHNLSTALSADANYRVSIPLAASRSPLTTSHLQNVIYSTVLLLGYCCWGYIVVGDAIFPHEVTLSALNGRFTNRVNFCVTLVMLHQEFDLLSNHHSHFDCYMYNKWLIAW